MEEARACVQNKTKAQQGGGVTKVGVAGKKGEVKRYIEGPGVSLRTNVRARVVARYVCFDFLR